MRILFVLGPSGAGKSTLAEQFGRRLGYLFYEIDQFPAADGIDAHQLRSEWNHFLKYAAPEKLVGELTKRVRAAGKAGIVLAFPSVLILSGQHLFALGGRVRVVYLTGTESQCRNAFLDRELRNPRGLDAAHWERHNRSIFGFLTTPEGTKYAVRVFRDDGGRRSIEEIQTSILATPE